MKVVHPVIYIPIFVILSFSLFITTSNCEVTSPTVAVLPFENLNRDPTYELLSRGMCESLIAGLSSVQSLILVERAQVEKILKEQALGLTGAVDEKTAPKTGQLLGAKYVVMGSYQVIGKKVRIIARFVDAETGQIDQSKIASVTGAYPDGVFDLQDKIAAHLIASFNVAANKAETDQMAGILKSTKDYSAYELYIMGRNAYLLSTEQGYQEAITFFKKAVEKDPRYALAYAGLSEAYTAWGRYKDMFGEDNLDIYKAGGDYAIQALKLTYYLGAAQRSYAFIELALGDTTEAKKGAREAVKFSPRDAEAWFVLWLTTERNPDHSYIRKALTLNPSLEMAHSERGRQFAIRGKKAEAIAELNDATRLSPNVFYTHHWRAIMYTELGMDSIALTEAKTAYELEPRDINAQALLARLYEKAGDNLNAKQQAENVLQKNPRNSRAHLVLGSLFYKLKEYDRAIAEFQLAYQYSGHQLSIGKLIAVPLANKGTDAYRKDDYVTAARFFEEAMKYNSDVLLIVRLPLARSYHFQGKYEAAMPLYRAEAESNPKESRATTSYANCLYLAGRLDEAKDYSQKILETTTDPQLMNFFQSFLGFVFLDQGNSDEAIAWWKHSQTTDPNNPEILAGLAIATYAKGDQKEALRLIKEAAKKDSRFIDTEWLSSYKGAQWSPNAVRLAGQVIKLIR